IRLAYRRAIRWVVESRRLLRSVAIALAIFVAALLFTQWWDFTVPAVGRAQYQAVFLTNGQTYFGRYYDRIGAYAKIEDVYYLQLIGSERMSAVLFLDDQAYFGHLDDSGETGTLTLRDVYYFKNSEGGPTGVAVGLVRRGTEAHEPADGMRINRDRILAIERVGNGSAVALAVQVERELLHASPGNVSLNRTSVGTSAALAAQRVAAEHDIERAWIAAADQLRKLNDLVLPVSKTEAQTITEKALGDLRTVRRDA